jgi:Acyl-CoA carboxylase epsilon subunit
MSTVQPPRQPDRDAGPYLRIVRGEPTGAEVAALVAVLAARAAAASRAEPPPRSAWADPARSLRGPVRPGPDAWRRSALP